MTRDKDFKGLVRARMRSTGERYTTARVALLRQKEESKMVPVTVRTTIKELTDEELERWTEQLRALPDSGFARDAVVSKVMHWLILTETGGERRLLIACGTVEHGAISQALEGVKTQRPMTHDLLRDVVTAMGEAREVRITDLRDSTFYAELVVATREGEERTVSCRPSDGIALAVRAAIPILVNEPLFEMAAKK